MMRSNTILSIAAAVVLVNEPSAAATLGSAVAERSEKALEHYDEGRFQEALETYREAQIEHPELPELQYNLGNALYKTGDFDSAAKAFKEAVARAPGSSLPQRSLYNLGNALFNQQAYGEAAAAYKQALEGGFDDEDVRSNLELALQRLQQQEQQQQQDNQQNEEEDESSESQQNQPDSSQQRQKQEDEGDQSENESEGSPPQTGEQPPRDRDDEEGTGETVPEDAKMAREEAEQLLDALADSEQEAQRRRFRARPSAQQRDW